MQKIMGYFKSYRFYLHILVIASLGMVFVPALNPIISYESANKRALLSVFTELGDIERYFESILSSFSVLGGTLYVAMLLIYASLIFYLAGLILNFAKGKGGKRVIFMGSIVLMLSSALLLVVYYCINIELLEFGGFASIADQGDVWKNIPIGIYCYFATSFAIFVLSILGSGIDFKGVWYGMRLNWIHRFSGGVHPTGHKNTRSKPIETLPPQKEMIYPLSQHIGAMCEPLVKVGDYVHLGQKIADSSAAVSAPIHSTVSGTVKKICDWDHPTGNRIPAIVIENDFEDNRDNFFQNACPDYAEKTPEELIAMIREAGVVGMGGAAFPTHIKLQSGLGKVDSVIINAAECEPYLSSDHRVIVEATDELLGGIKIVRHIMGAKNIYIGIENNKPDAISLLHKRLAKSRVKVVILKTKYPQGGEKQLIRAVTGREVPSGKLPADVGCLVINVDTVVAIYRAVVNGMPLMRRIVTVAGHGVERVGNVHVRIGTPFSAVLENFDFDRQATRKIIMGGPMMGTAQYSLDAPVIKGTSGLICMTKEQLTVDRDGGCIRCGSCVSACPMKLVPNYIAQYVKKENYEQVEKLHAGDCIECGCCSFTCPAKIPLIQYMRLGKQKVNEMKRNKVGGKN